MQLLDGIGAGIFGAITPLVIADLMRGAGHYNLAQGAVATVQGVGASLSGLVAGVVVGKRLLMAALFGVDVIWFAARVETSGACLRQWQPQWQLHSLGSRLLANGGALMTLRSGRGWLLHLSSSTFACATWPGGMGSAQA